MIEEYDDDDVRETRAWSKSVERAVKNLDAQYGHYVPPSYPKPENQPVVPTCAYCLPAIKGGPMVGTHWHQDKGIKHWVRVAAETPTSNYGMNRGLSVWTLEAACGAVFNATVDSGD